VTRARRLPTAIARAAGPHLARWLPRLGWLLLALPGLWQVALLVYTVAHRFAYPYDLEWMEGGLLHHAQRIADGDGLYVAPSVDFIPYLYTPLYPGLVATAGAAFGISYQLGRAISILALLGIAAITIASIAGPAWRARPARVIGDDGAPVPVSPADEAGAATDRAAAWTGVAVALGLFAATYPWVEGWYDLVRADTLFLAMVTAGVHAAARWARADRGAVGHARVAAVAAVLALAFFTKQTGIIYVAAGGAVVLVLNWRRAATYAVTAGLIGLIGTWLLERSSGGWFWIYVRKLHQEHDFHMPRFWDSFGHILWHFPAMTLAVAAGVAAVIACAIVRRTVPAAARPLLLWAPMFAVSTLVGALGFGTQWAHYNAYMPAMLHGGIAAGAALPAVAACARAIVGRRSPAVTIGTAAAVLVAVVASLQLRAVRWRPRDFIPTTADRAAGAALIHRLAAIDGDIWVPSHPWYAHLAGKRMYVHRMGIKDVTERLRGARWGWLHEIMAWARSGVLPPREIVGLDQALRESRFAAIVVDSPNDVHLWPAVARSYRFEERLSRRERPRVYTGAKVQPAELWVPAAPARLPAGARVLFDFERGDFDGWDRQGSAWGSRPEMRPETGQDQVGGFGGRYFVTSHHGGDQAVGILLSPEFIIDGSRITLRLGGGTDHRAVRAELRLSNDVALIAAAPAPAGERLSIVEWDVSGLQGRPVRIALVDQSTASWGHLNVDEIWIWK